MNYYSEEEKAKALNSRIESYRRAANLAPVIIKTVQSFDGKVFNCRLDKALRAATDNLIGAYQSGDYVEIYATYTNCYHHINLARFNLKDLTNKRIDAEKITEQVRHRRENLLKDAYTLETYAEQAGNIKAYIDAAIEKINSYCQALPNDFRDIYNIPYCIRKY